MGIIKLNGIDYPSGGGGGGTTVIANPADPPTQTLNTIQIGSTVYELPTSGNGTPLVQIRGARPTEDAVSTTVTITQV